MGHTPDIGGVSAGSRNATSRDIFGEGLQIMPVRYMRNYELVQDTATFVRANSRVPEMMIGDLSAKAGVCFTIGEERVKDALRTYGKETLLQMFDDLGERTEQQARDYISRWKDGVSESETWVDDPSNPASPSACTLPPSRRATGSSWTSPPLATRPPLPSTCGNRSSAASSTTASSA